MKKTLVLLITVLFCALTASAQNKTNFLTNGGPHVITGAAVSGCAACHTPHNGAHAETLLWALAYPGAGSPITFSTYQRTLFSTGGSTLPAPTSGTDPQAHSYLCLSCHDGVAATANFGPSGYLNGATKPGADHNITNGNVADLANDHPINFDYVDPLPAGASGAYATQATLLGSPNVKLFGTTKTVQCATCHDPHNVNAAGAGDFLRTATVTALCVTCHL